MNKTIRRYYFLGGCVLLLLAVLGSYVAAIPEVPVASYEAIAGHAGRLLGLLGLVLLGSTLLLGGRPGYLERYLGLGTLMKLHRPLGVLTLICFLAHALLLSSRHALLNNLSWFELMGLYAQLPVMLLGQIGLILLVLAGVTAFLGKYRLLGYAFWKKFHILVYFGTSLGLLHALFRGEDMRSPVMLVIWGLAFYCLADGAVRRFLKVMTRRNWLPYVVGRVTPESADTTSVSFLPEDGERKLDRIHPGQFLLLRIKGKGGWSEPHPFSIVSRPDGEEVCVSIKRAGMFTGNAHGLHPEDKVLVCGPYGTFCADALEQHSLCCIAGGMGITPFLSLLRTMRGQEKTPRMRLIWSVRTYEQAFALEELREMQKELPLDLTVLCSREFGERLIALDGRGFKLEAGRINATHLRQCVLNGASIYCCAPAEMQKSVNSLLRELGVKPAQVQRESFAW